MRAYQGPRKTGVVAAPDPGREGHLDTGTENIWAETSFMPSSLALALWALLSPEGLRPKGWFLLL